MDALAFFALRYGDVHKEFDGLLDGLTDAQLRQRPHGANPVAWLLWHVARCEDVGVNRFVVDRPQVLDDEGWLPRLNVPRRDVGAEMTGAEVADLCERVDAAALRGYWQAVYRRTLGVVRGLAPADLEAPVSPAHVRRVAVEEGAVGPNAGWLEPYWAAKPNRGWFLADLALTHSWGHCYEAFATRGLLGTGAP